MKESNLGSEEFKARGRDIMALKTKWAVSTLNCFSALFVFMGSLIIFPVDRTEQIQLLPLSYLLIGTGGFSLSMIASVIWYSEFKNLIEKSSGWQHLYVYGKSDLQVLGGVGILLNVLGLLVAWNYPAVGFVILAISAIATMLTGAYLLIQINRETKQKTFHA